MATDKKFSLVDKNGNPLNYISYIRGKYLKLKALYWKENEDSLGWNQNITLLTNALKRNEN